MNIKLITDWINANQPHGRTKLAGLSEISLGTLLKILRGHTPNVRVAKRIAKVIGCDLGPLCEDTEEEPKKASA